MYNWMVETDHAKEELRAMIMSDLERLLEEDATDETSANYWIDNAHNVFAFINNNGDGDRWIEIHLELYDFRGDMLGDLFVSQTEEVLYRDLNHEIKAVVDFYFNI